VLLRVVYFFNKTGDGHSIDAQSSSVSSSGMGGVEEKLSLANIFLPGILSPNDHLCSLAD
jgi:hypothetical protein